MIKSFRDKETEKVYRQQFSTKLPQDVQKTALRKLIMLDNASGLSDLRVPPSNHLEALKGARLGQYSITRQRMSPTSTSGGGTSKQAGAYLPPR